MAKPARILCLDIGASELKIAEFFISRQQGGIELGNYAIGAVPHDPDSEASRGATVVATIREMMLESGISAGPLLLSISGQNVFPRYVRLPAVPVDQIRKIIRYEAEQNVPFPIDEVVWDYQLISTDDEGMNVLLVAVKNDVVRELTDMVSQTGMVPEIVDVAPMALYNAARQSYDEVDGCTLIVDIGARTTNLIFSDERGIFSRSIPVAGNAITQDIMKEFEIPFDDAEGLKKQHGSVGLGGVYQSSDGELADRISRIVRGVMTRMHAEINRSINYYRMQQGGSQPVRVLLAGGGSVMPHTDTFFKDKLKVDVEHLDPFRRIQFGDAVAEEDVVANRQILGEVVGLAFRRAGHCPMEIDLMPPEIVANRRYRRRLPYFYVAEVLAVAIAVLWWSYFGRQRAESVEHVKAMTARADALHAVDGQIKKLKSESAAIATKVDSLLTLIDRRPQFHVMLGEIGDALPDGLWLKQVSPVVEAAGKGARHVTRIELVGMAFSDQESNGVLTGDFRTKLRASSSFTDDTDITKHPIVKVGDPFVEFSIVAVLANPIPFQ